MQVILPDQTIEIEDDIATNDEQLKKVLAPAVPWIANADFKREGDSVRVTKRAGTKGRTALHALLRAPEHINPATALHRRILEMEKAAPLTAAQLSAMAKEMEMAREQGRLEIQETRLALQALQCAPADPGAILPVGF